MRMPVCLSSGINSCSRLKSIERKAPVAGSSDILIVPPVNSNNTALSLSTLKKLRFADKDNGIFYEFAFKMTFCFRKRHFETVCFLFETQHLILYLFS